MMRILPLRSLAVLAYMAMVLALTTLPGRQVARWGINSALLDLAHIPLFTGLTLVTLWAVVGPRVQRFAFVVLAIVAFAAVDEWLQRFAPGRVASLSDFVRDVIGVGIGVALAEASRPLVLAFRRESQR
ncbi:MAG: VanZ family protein [Myxococcota bacterium]